MEACDTLPILLHRQLIDDFVSKLDMVSLVTGSRLLVSVVSWGRTNFSVVLSVHREFLVTGTVQGIVYIHRVLLVTMLG